MFGREHENNPTSYWWSTYKFLFDKATESTNIAPFEPDRSYEIAMRSTQFLVVGFVAVLIVYVFVTLIWDQYCRFRVEKILLDEHVVLFITEVMRLSSEIVVARQQRTRLLKAWSEISKSVVTNSGGPKIPEESISTVSVNCSTECSLMLLSVPLNVLLNAG